MVLVTSLSSWLVAVAIKHRVLSDDDPIFFFASYTKQITSLIVPSFSEEKYRDCRLGCQIGIELALLRIGGVCKGSNLKDAVEKINFHEKTERRFIHDVDHFLICFVCNGVESVSKFRSPRTVGILRAKSPSKKCSNKREVLGP